MKVGIRNLSTTLLMVVLLTTAPFKTYAKDILLGVDAGAGYMYGSSNVAAELSTNAHIAYEITKEWSLGLSSSNLTRPWNDYTSWVGLLALFAQYRLSFNLGIQVQAGWGWLYLYVPQRARQTITGLSIGMKIDYSIHVPHTPKWLYVYPAIGTNAFIMNENFYLTQYVSAGVIAKF